MLSVPSHEWFCFPNSASSSYILILLHTSFWFLLSFHDISQADPAIIPVRPFTSVTAHLSDHNAMHLPAGCVQPRDPSARTTGRSL